MANVAIPNRISGQAHPGPGEAGEHGSQDAKSKEGQTEQRKQNKDVMEAKNRPGANGQSEGAWDPASQLSKNEGPPIILLKEGVSQGNKDGHEPIIREQAEGVDFVEYGQGVNALLQEDIIAGEYDAGHKQAQTQSSQHTGSQATAKPTNVGQ